MGKKMEIHNMLMLSTAHLSKKTVDILQGNQTGSIHVENNTWLSFYDKEEYGWFVCISMWDEDIHEGSIPADLSRCVKFAVEHGCSWICFDRDVEPINELPEYN